MIRIGSFLFLALLAHGNEVHILRPSLTRKANTSLYFAAPVGAFASDELDSFADSHPDINVTLLDYSRAHGDEPLPYDPLWLFRDELPLLMQSELGPDIAHVHAGALVMGMKDHLLDLRPMLKEAGLMDVLEPTTYRSCQDPDGSIYCVGRGAVAWWFIMSWTVFQRHKLKIPETLEDLVESCGVLHKAGEIPIVVTGEYWLIADWLDMMDMRTNGVDFHVDLVKGMVPWTDPRVRRTFENWQKLIDANCFQRDLLKETMWSWPVRSAIQNKKAAMMYIWDTMRVSLWNFYQNTSDIDVFPFPKITTGIVRGNMFPQDAYVVRKTTKQVKPVSSYLSEEIFKKTAQVNDVVASVQPRTDSQIYDGRFMRKLQKMLGETDIPFGAFDQESPRNFYDAVKQPLRDWLNGTMTLDSMLNHFEEMRILMLLEQNLRPEASLPSGTYENEAIVSLEYSGGVSQQDREGLNLLYSINDDDVTLQYLEANGTMRLGIGDWTLRAYVAGGQRKDSTMLKYTYKVIRPQVVGESTSPVLMISIIVLGAILMFVGCIGLQRCMKSVIEGRKARFAQQVSRVSRIRKAIYNATNLSFPMCLVKFSTFEGHGKLLQHEVALQKGHLLFLHTFDEITEFLSDYLIIFISHQWLSFTEPDPDNTHFNAILSAVKELARIKGIDLAEVYLWVDYLSIPQRNVAIKLYSIASIAAYASAASLFIVVAPPTFHANTEKPCDKHTYAKRGWCRLEQWSCFALNGLGNMCIFDGELKALEQTDESCQQFAYVFAGDFTVEADKYDIVDLVVGLWAHSTYHASELGDVATGMLQNRAEIFPAKYFGELTDLVEPIVMEDLRNSQSALNRNAPQQWTKLSSDSSLGSREYQKIAIKRKNFKKLISASVSESTEVTQSAVVQSYSRSEKLVAKHSTTTTTIRDSGKSSIESIRDSGKSSIESQDSIILL